MRQKIIGGNLRYPHLVKYVSSHTRKNLKPRRVPKKYSGTVIQKYFDEKKRQIPFPHPYNLFAARNNLKHRRVPKKNFRKGQAKKSDQKK